jgi:hypothetical protein
MNIDGPKNTIQYVEGVMLNIFISYKLILFILFYILQRKMFELPFICVEQSKKILILLQN